MFAKSLVKACSYNPRQSSYKGFPLLFLIPLYGELFISPSYTHNLVPWLDYQKHQGSCLVSSTYTFYFFLFLNSKRNQKKSDKEKDLLFPLRNIIALSVGKSSVVNRSFVLPSSGNFSSIVSFLIA